MNFARTLRYVVVLAVVSSCTALLGACHRAPRTEPSDSVTKTPTDTIHARAKMEKIHKSNEEWKKELTELQYHVTREKGTERAFTGKYYDHHEDGTYTCSNCGAELFSSTNKFDSGCGWPSYDAPMDSTVVEEHEDTSYGMVRTEVVCSRCGAHLGHKFEDGPQNTTGLRYCINSASLNFRKKSK